jgi:RNA polymerase sigma-70 factor (ECF subfamily)
VTAKGLRLVRRKFGDTILNSAHPTPAAESELSMVSPKFRPPAGTLAELYEKHAAAVYGRCRWLLRDADEARDAMQDVFVKVLQSMGEFRGAAGPTTWMQRIATHHCLNVLRSKKAAWREQFRQLQEERQEQTEPPDRRELVRRVLSAAPDEAQEVAVLYFVDELTQQEIAVEMGRSLPTVRKRLKEFLECSRGLLGVEVPDEP